MFVIDLSAIFRCFGLFFLSAGVVWSQGGFVDPSFNAGIIPNGYVYAMAQQSDQKIVVGGSFTSIGGVPGSRIARLNANGTADATFNPRGGPNQAVSGLVIQGNGQIVIYGPFTTVGAYSRSGIARLNSDGSVDTIFNAGAGVNGNEIGAMAVQPDGKMVVGGYFHAFNGDSTKGNLVRLNLDGTVDPTFSGYTGLNGQVLSVVIQGNAKIVVSGRFTTVNGTTRKYVARLNPNGSLDMGFDAGTGPTLEGAKVLLQADGKLIVQDSFTGATAADSRRNLYRLNAEGTLDPSFNVGTGFGIGVPNASLGPDDRVVVAGDFTTVDGLTRLRIARLQINGAVDPLFDPGSLIPTATNPAFNAILIQADGKVVLAPYGKPMFRLMAAGELPPSGAAPAISALADGQGIRLMWSDVTHEEGYKVERSSDGGSSWSLVKTLTGERTLRIYDGGLVAGNTYHYRVRAFNRYGDGSVSGPFAANVQNGVWPGQIDLSLDPYPAGIVGGAAASVTEPDGKLIVAARFQSNPGTTARTMIARLNIDGSLERLFDAVSDYSEKYSLLLQPDGKLVAAGSFKVTNGTVQRTIARFNPDGTEDTEFSAVVWSQYGYGSVLAMALQADGKLLIGGYFNRANQITSGHVARLNSDGTVDGTFNPGTGANDSVYSLALDSTGRIVIGGNFNQVNGTSSGRVARLLANGSLDPAFSASPGANGVVKCLAMQPDGRLIMAGDFNSYNSAACNRVLRLNEDGSIDSTFTVPAGPNQITALFLQPDGNSIIAGNFEQVGDTARRSLARLTGTGSLDPSFDAGGSVSFTSISASSNGKIVVAGDVTFANGMTQSGLTRLSITGGPPPPPKPLGLTASGINASKVQLTWIDVSGEAGYLVDRSPDGFGGWSLVGQASADSPTFTDSGLAQGTRYYYRVRSSNFQGVSAPSDPGNAYTMVLPVAPTQIEVRSYGGTQAILTWKTSGYTDSFVIERSSTGTGGWTFVATVSLYDDIYRDSGLNPETQYFYRIRAVNSGGDSDATTSIAATTAALGWVPAGSLDPTFTTGVGFAKTPDDYNGTGVNEILLQSNGKLIVCGRFGSYQGLTRKNIARLNSDGSIDPSFDPGAWGSSYIEAAALQSDGKIVVGGSFIGLDGSTHPNIVRLKPDGTIDPTFSATAAMSAVEYTAFYYGLQSLLVQADGKVIGGGSSLIRLNSDGSKDTGFTAAVSGSGFTPWIYSIVTTTTGQIMLSGSFSTINGTTRRDLARLNSNGSVDISFDAGILYSSGNGFSFGYVIVIQLDGKILRANPRYSAGALNRYNSNGTLDGSFVPPVLSYESVLQNVALQSDGKVVVVGSFTSIAGSRRTGMARLKADGTLDATLDSGLGSGGSALVILPDGKILIGGGFTTVDGQPRSHVARILGAPVTWDSLQLWKLGFGISPIAPDNSDLDLDGMSGLVEYALGGNPLISDPQIRPLPIVTPASLSLAYTKLRSDVSYLVETSSDLKSWTSNTVDQGGTQATVTASVPCGTAPQKFLRLRVRRP